MEAASAVSAVVARIEYLTRDIEEDIFMQLRSKLAEAVTYLEAYDSFTSKRVLEKDVIQLAYHIEDSTESYVRVREGVVGPCGSFFKFFSWRSLKDDLSIFRRMINEVKSQMGNYSPDKSLSLGAAELGTEKSNYDNIKTTTSLQMTSDVVGLTGVVKKLSSVLVNGENHLSVMTITGIGGIGKTTLARSLFDHPSVEKHFDFRTWAHAGLDFQARGILEYILSNIYSGGSRKKIEEMESIELMEGIYQAFKGKRYLVVLDDIWSSNDWETISFAFPDDNNGSRVIITSRSKDVAHRSAYNYRYEMSPLTLEESWELMKTRLGRQDLDMKAEEIGQQILKHCGGVPLAITVFSAQLKFRQLENWEGLLQHLEQDDQHYQNRNENFLEVGYNLLPVHLKPCFLYLGHFPTDHAILIEKLYLMWIAEGFISTKGMPNASKIDIAEDYFKELVERSMVMIQEEEVLDIRRSKSCQIHDLLRDLCLEKGMEEEFFRVVNFGRVNSKRFVSHRLAIYLSMHEPADGVSLSIPEAKNVRSLLFFEINGPLAKPNSRWPVEVADLKEFRWARLLDFDGVDFRVKLLPKNIKRLVYLRYLSFRGCYLLEFPSSFGNLSFLETLDLLVQETCRITISNVLWNFKRLRHLYLPVEFQIDSKAQDHKLKLNGLTELEILKNFHASLCDANDLDMLENIKSFTGVVDGNNDDLEKIVKCLKRWKITSSGQSSLGVKNFDCYSEKRFSIVEKLLTRCKTLPSLEIEGHLPRLPSYTDISPNFTEMVFNRSEFEQDPMQILGKLPKLRTLVLSNNAFAGKEMVCSESDFPQLTILKLAMLQRLRKWEVNSGSMPNLALLTIEQCKGLQTLPDELMEITTLKEIKIGSMPQKFQQNVRSMAEKLRVHAEVRITLYTY